MASTKNDSTLVSLGKFQIGGYAYWAPYGTPLPTDSATPLPDAFKLLGYVSEDGITLTTDTDTTEVKDANGVTVMKVISSYAESCQFALLEVLRAEAAKLRYNSAAVSGEDKSMTIRHQMPSDEAFVLVFELALTGGVKDRMVIGNGTRAEFDDRQVHAGDAQVYDVTVSMNDMDGTGVTCIEYVGVPAPAQGGKAAEAAVRDESLMARVVDPTRHEQAGQPGGQESTAPAPAAAAPTGEEAGA